MTEAAALPGTPRPLCFVLMPFGMKLDPAGHTVDFDSVYQTLIGPAIEEAGMEPLRADEERVGGLIHKPMFERLVLCEFAVADLTTANANVYYELGLRHGVRPWSTVLLFAAGTRLPFDVAPVRALAYDLDGGGRPKDVEKSQAALVQRLRDARNAIPDSPVFQLVDDMRPQEIDRLKTDTFRDRTAIATGAKRKLAAARKQGAEAVRAEGLRLAGECPIEDTEAGVVLDLFLSYRAVKAWQDMIDLVSAMAKPLVITVMVQEQLALALNRASRGDEAEAVLLAVLEKHGPSSETYGILGRVFKDRWESALKSGDAAARGFLRKAIEAYLKGFEADWRDAYPGINAVTLMELSEPPDDRRLSLLPVVRYAVKRRLDAGTPDYWDHASWLELAVLARDEETAESALGDALACVREVWEPESTARNLRLIREAGERREGAAPAWIQAAEDALRARAGQART